MDTDDLTRAAYHVLIVRSGEISDWLRPQIGAAASRFKDEDAYLAAMHKRVSAIAQNPAGFLDFWNHAEEIDPEQFRPLVEKLAEEIQAVMKTPYDERGPVGV